MPGCAPAPAAAEGAGGCCCWRGSAAAYLQYASAIAAWSVLGSSPPPGSWGSPLSGSGSGSEAGGGSGERSEVVVVEPRGRTGG